MMTGLHPVCAPSQTIPMGCNFLSGKMVLIVNLVPSSLLRWFLEVSGVRTVVGTASTLVCSHVKNSIDNGDLKTIYLYIMQVQAINATLTTTYENVCGVMQK